MERQHTDCAGRRPCLHQPSTYAPEGALAKRLETRVLVLVLPPVPVRRGFLPVKSANMWPLTHVLGVLPYSQPLSQVVNDFLA